jgi:hypothetical protein
MSKVYKEHSTFLCNREEYRKNMNKICFVIAIISILIISSCADRSNEIVNPPDSDSSFTDLSGSLEGILEFKNSPFRVIDNIQIDEGNSLRIEAGVRLFFSDSCNFVVHGTLNAVGSQNNYILFTAVNEKWKGIRILNSAQQSTIRFCIFEKVKITSEDSLEFGALEVKQSSVTIRNNIFRDNRTVNGGGLALLGDSALVTNNIFRDNLVEVFGGAIITVESSANIYNNTINNNRSFNHGGGLVIFEPVNLDIQNNLFFQNDATTGDPRISFVSGNPGNYSESFNFLAFGTMDPQFINDQNLHLQIGSPCIDNGNPDAAFNDTNGTRNDQGAYGGPYGSW